MSNAEKTTVNGVEPVSAGGLPNGAAPHLSRVLKPIHLWALAVGLVISGNYFGWSYGFGAGGPIGLAIALIPVTIFYVTFILSYSELATAIPHAGGPSAYARRAMGKFAGYMNGVSCLIEFVFRTSGHCAGGGRLHPQHAAVHSCDACDSICILAIHIYQLLGNENLGDL